MSLKAKIEAVIYASEEPVTLLQLAGLLGLEAQAELDALAARQGRLHLAAAEDAGGQTAALEDGGSDEMLAAVDLPEAEVGPTHDDGAVMNGARGEVGEAAKGEGPTHDDGAVMNGARGEVGEGAAEVTEDTVAEVGSDSAGEKRQGRERERRLREFLRETVAELIEEYATSERGIEVREVAGGYRMATKPEYHDAVRGFVKSLKPVLKLTLQALETLAVVAYKQPVTAPEISEIRGVDSGGVLGSLMARKLITTAGRKQVVGRPILYKTTKDFLLRFGLRDVNELPSIEEFEKMAGELADAEPMQEEIPMSSAEDNSDHESEQERAEERITHENLVEEKDASMPQADGDSTSLEGDDSNRPDDELPAVDGRMSGLDPTYDRPGDDPSAEEAAIQSGE